MSITTPEEFAKRMLLLGEPADQFVPTAYYDRDGDCIELVTRPDPFRAERVDDLVTVYYSQESGEVVGSLIKGVSKFCDEMLRKMPGFKIEIQDGRVRLVHIFRARLWSIQRGPDDLETLVYRKLIQVAERSGIDVDAGLCMA